MGNKQFVTKQTIKFPKELSVERILQIFEEVTINFREKYDLQTSYDDGDCLRPYARSSFSYENLTIKDPLKKGIMYKEIVVVDCEPVGMVFTDGCINENAAIINFAKEFCSLFIEKLGTYYEWYAAGFLNPVFFKKNGILLFRFKI